MWFEIDFLRLSTLSFYIPRLFMSDSVVHTGNCILAYLYVRTSMGLHAHWCSLLTWIGCVSWTLRHIPVFVPISQGTRFNYMYTLVFNSGSLFEQHYCVVIVIEQIWWYQCWRRPSLPVHRVNRCPTYVLLCGIPSPHTNLHRTCTQISAKSRVLLQCSRKLSR